MKNKFKYFLIIPAVSLLTSCALSGTVIGKNTSEKKVNLYSLVGDDESENFDDYLIGEVSARVINGQEEVLFVNLPTFASLYANRLIKPDYTYQASNYEWTMYNKNNELVYYFGIDAIHHTFALGGDLSDSLISEVDYSKSSLYAGFQHTENMIKTGENLELYTFDNMGFDYFFHNKELYLPLSLLSNATSNSGDLYYLYDYNGHIIQYDSSDELSEIEFKDGENTFTVQSMMKNYATTTLNNQMPEYVAREKLANFEFIFINFYGLACTRNISDMRSYLNGLSYLEGIYSSDPVVSEAKLGEFIASLNDGHTSYSNAGSGWYQNKIDSNGPIWQERISVLYSLLTTLSMLYSNEGLPTGDPIYSEDGKMAFIPFANFSWIEDAYNEDGTLKDIVYSKDSFFGLARKLETVKQKGGVEKVILDISCNLGGTLGVMMKILTLLSKDNSGKMYFYNSKLNYISEDNFQVDTNMDGEYNLDDVYGDDFKFYLLTSPCSFSCGNALPFLAKANGFAKIIGITSGGGECSVGQHMLPTGERVGHSSHTHIGWYNEEKGFIGVEGGATPDQQLMYIMFRDIENLRGVINNL